MYNIVHNLQSVFITNFLQNLCNVALILQSRQIVIGTYDYVYIIMILKYESLILFAHCLTQVDYNNYAIVYDDA